MMEEMTPGRAMDALIGQKMFGLNIQHGRAWEQRSGPGGPSIREIDLPRYSTSIQDAWEVVEKMTENSGDLGGYGPDFQLSKVYNDPDRKKFVATFNDNYGKTNWKEKMAIESADTAPHAICLAALKAMENK